MTVMGLVLSLVTAMPSVASAQDAVVDQTLEGDPPCTVEHFPGEPVLDALTPLRQGFVPSGGAISGVDLCLTVTDGASFESLTPATVKIIAFDEAGAEEVVVSQRLSAEAYTAAAGQTGYVHFAFDEVAPLTPGVLHAIQLDAPRLTYRWRATCGGTAPCDSDDDRYPDGMATGLGGLLGGRLGLLSVLEENDVDADFGFRTYLPGPGDLVVDVDAPALVCPAAGSLDLLAVTVRNLGASAVAPFTVDLALDVDGVLQPLGSVDVASLAGGAEVVLDGAALDLAVPADGPPARAEIVATVDPADAVTEFDDDNNTGVGATTRVSCDEGALEDLTLVAGDGSPLPRVTAGLVDLPIADLPPAVIAAGAAGFAAPLGATAAGAPTSAAPRDADTIQAAPTHFSPTHFSPTHFSPTHFSPTHFSPTHFSPTHFSPTHFSATLYSTILAAVDEALLDRIPLVTLQTAVTWEQQLAEYPDQPDVQAALSPEAARAAADAVLAIPAQDRTLADVLVRLDPPLDVRLHEVGVGGGLDLSFLGVALSTQPLATVPTPTGEDWCTFLSATSFLDCASAGIDPATETFAGLDLRGYPMGQLDLTGVALADIDLRPDTVLNGIPLADRRSQPADGEPAATARILRLQYTVLGAMDASEAFTDPATVLVCDGTIAPDPCAGTVADAEAAFAFRDDVELVEVLDALDPSAAAAFDVTNGLLAITGGLDLPWSRFDLDPLDADELTGGTCPSIDYTLTAAVVGAPVVDPVLSVVLPTGFDVCAGSATARVDGAAAVALDAVAEVATTDGRTRLDLTVPAIVTEAVEVTVAACANALLGVAVADAEASWTTFGDGPVLVERSLGPDDGAFPDRHADVLVTEAEEPDAPGRVLVPETVTYRHVPTGGDVDAFEIPIGTPLPGGPTVQPGDRLRIWAAPPVGAEPDGDVVDIDLAVFGGERDDLTDHLLGSTSLAGADTPIIPVRDVTLADGQYGSAPPGSVQDAPTHFSPTHFSPTHFSPTRFSATRAVSNQRGDRTEYVEFDVRAGETGSLSVQVSSYLGSASARPYALYYTVQRPIVAEELAACPAPGDVDAGAIAGDLPPIDADTRTLVLVNETLSRTVHGDAATDTMLARLTTLAAHPTVGGQVLSVELDDDVAAAYEAWRSGDGWCDPAAANAVAGAVRQVVVDAAEVAPIEAVILVGSDALLPHARLSDDVDLAPEDTYLGQVLAATQRNNPLVAAMAAGTVLSDDPYGTLAPLAWEDEAVFVPELAVGRLVETPADVVVAVDQYLLADGLLDADTAVAAGYDFNSDGAAAAATGLGELGADVDDAFVVGGWDRADLSAVLGQAPDLAVVHAHTDHRALLTAAGDATDDAATYLAEQLTTRSVQGDDLPLGRVTFSIGCHFGTSVADAYVSDGPPLLDVDGDPLDWAQLVAGRAGVLVANTGYGYGTDEAVAYSERLMGDFAARTARTATVGAAFAAAKADYLAGIATPSPLHRKSLQEAVFHGIPTYRFHDTPPVADDVPATEVEVDPVTGLQTFALDTGALMVGGADCTSCLRPVVADGARRGTHYDLVGPGAEGDPLVVSGRAVVPQFEHRVRLPGVEVGGFVPDVLESVDVAGPGGALDAFDPVIGRALLADAEREQPTEVLDQSGPGTFARSTRIGDDVVLTLPLGAFRGEAHDASGEVLGRHRLDTRVAGRVYLRDTTRSEVDRLPPEVIGLDVSSLQVPTGDLLSVTLTTVDDGTPSRGVVALRVAGDWHLVELAVPGDAGSTAVLRGTVAVPAGAGVEEVQYWVVDDSGNVGFGYRKGLEPLVRPIVPSPEVMPGDPEITLTGDRVGDVYRSDVVVSISGGASSLYHVFVNGQPEPVATLPVGGTTTLSGTGAYEVVAVADDDTGRLSVAAVAIDVTPPTVAFTSPNAGAPLTDRTWRVGDTVPIELRCADVLTGVASCTTDDADGLLDTDRVGDFTLTATAVDNVGHETSTSVTYRVTSAFRFVGWKNPVDNGRVTVKAGSSTTFRYLLADEGGEVTDTAVIEGATFEEVACDGSALPGTSPVPAPDKKDPVYFHGDHFHHDTVTDRRWRKGSCWAYTVTLVDGLTFSAIIDVT